MFYFAVTGRIEGDDEDTLLLVGLCKNEADARSAFKDDLRAMRNIYPDDEREIFIGAIVYSKTEIME